MVHPFYYDINGRKVKWRPLYELVQEVTHFHEFNAVLDLLPKKSVAIKGLIAENANLFLSYLRVIYINL